jgi:hypothetical protein
MIEKIKFVLKRVIELPRRSLYYWSDRVTHPSPGHQKSVSLKAGRQRLMSFAHRIFIGWWPEVQSRAY